MSTPIALQLYTLRDVLKIDFTKTIQKVAEMGYVAVEPYQGMPMPAQDAKKLFDDLGLLVTSAHLPMPVGDEKNKHLETASILGIQTYVIPFQPPEEFSTIDKIKQVCERLNLAQEAVNEQGLSLAYHNHWWELEEVEGQIAFDVMLENLESSILFELDTYWVQTGGANVIDVLIELGERAPLLHIKDGPATSSEQPMVAVGEGVMKFHDIIGASGDNVTHLIVELDHCATDMLTAVEKSYQYLIKEGLGHGNKG